MTRLRCRLFSCEYDGYQACRRCGEWLYGGLFIETGYVTGWINAVVRCYDRFRDWTGRYKRCGHCGKKFWTHGDYCCSDECYSEWVPF